MKANTAGNGAAHGMSAGVAERLHQAVRAAGGNQAVAERSGIPLATVNNYVRGRNGMKIEPLAALAAACNVPLQWLVSGDARPLPGLAAEQPGPLLDLGEAVASSPSVTGGIDVANLAKAIEIVRAVSGDGVLDEDPKRLARRIASAYAVLVQPSTMSD